LAGLGSSDRIVINEANAYNPSCKTDYYGENYGKLLEIKRKYDLSGSLFVLAGVGSDEWDYNLNTGKLCQVPDVSNVVVQVRGAL
jgi:hypothetical protein